MINELDASGLAVDEDTDKAMLQEALKQHEGNVDVFDPYSHLPYRDSVSALTGTQPYITNNPANYLEEIRGSGIPVYHWAGWYDNVPQARALVVQQSDEPAKNRDRPLGASTIGAP